MTMAQLLRLTESGEDSTLEFARDGIANHQLAKELVAFLNLEGGTLLLGVEDDGTVYGTTPDNWEEWAANFCRDKIEPPVTPLLSWMKDAKPGRDVLTGDSRREWCPQALRASSPRPQGILHSCWRRFSQGQPGGTGANVPAYQTRALRSEARTRRPASPSRSAGSRSPWTPHTPPPQPSHGSMRLR